MEQPDIADAIQNPLTIVNGQETDVGKTVKVIGNRATVILNEAGDGITGYPTKTKIRLKILALVGSILFGVGYQISPEFKNLIDTTFSLKEPSTPKPNL